MSYHVSRLLTIANNPQMTQTETRSAPLGLRIRPSLKTTLEKLAKADKRSLASYIELALEAHVAKAKGKKK